MSEARAEQIQIAGRLDRLEAEMREVKAILERLAPLVIRIDQRLTSELPHLATKAELMATKAELTAGLAELKVAIADKPGKVFLATAIGVLVAVYALGLAGLAALPVVAKLLH